MFSFYLRPDFPICLFPSGFPTENLYKPLLSHIHATCTTHLILGDWITRIIFSEKFRSKSSSLCSLLQSPVISSPLAQNIFLSTLFSNPIKLFSSLKLRGQVSHSYKLTGNFTVLMHHRWLTSPTDYITILNFRTTIAGLCLENEHKSPGHRIVRATKFCRVTSNVVDIILVVFSLHFKNCIRTHRAEDARQQWGSQLTPQNFEPLV